MGAREVPRAEPVVTSQDLSEVEAAYRAAFRHAEMLRGRRNALVCRALSAGWTQRDVAEATGLTHGRIAQIASSPKKGFPPNRLRAER